MLDVDSNISSVSCVAMYVEGQLALSVAPARLITLSFCDACLASHSGPDIPPSRHLRIAFIAIQPPCADRADYKAASIWKHLCLSLCWRNHEWP